MSIFNIFFLIKILIKTLVTESLFRIFFVFNFYFDFFVHFCYFDFFLIRITFIFYIYTNDLHIDSLIYMLFI